MCCIFVFIIRLVEWEQKIFAFFFPWLCWLWCQSPQSVAGIGVELQSPPHRYVHKWRKYICKKRHDVDGNGYIRSSHIPNDNNNGDGEYSILTASVVLLLPHTVCSEIKGERKKQPSEISNGRGWQRRTNFLWKQRRAALVQKWKSLRMKDGKKRRLCSPECVGAPAACVRSLLVCASTGRMVAYKHFGDGKSNTHAWPKWGYECEMDFDKTTATTISSPDIRTCSATCSLVRIYISFLHFFVCLTCDRHMWDDIYYAIAATEWIDWRQWRRRTMLLLLVMVVG